MHGKFKCYDQLMPFCTCYMHCVLQDIREEIPFVHAFARTEARKVSEELMAIAKQPILSAFAHQQCLL